MPVHPTAVVDPAATLDPTADIGPYVVIDAGVTIGARTRVISHAHISGQTTIGAGCTIHAFSSIGDAPQDRSYQGEPSGCRIGDRATIREGVTIHRGSTSAAPTSIGDDCFIMAHAHVAHDCTVEDHVVLANSVLLGGHVHVGTRTFISGGVAVHQFVRIGELAMVGGLSKVVMDIPPFFTVDRDGRCAGVNVVGMRRAGFSREERAEVQEGFRALYRSARPFQEVLVALIQEFVTPVGARLTAFLAGASKRGITSGRQRPAPRRDGDSSALILC